MSNNDQSTHKKTDNRNVNSVNPAAEEKPSPNSGKNTSKWKFLTKKTVTITLAIVALVSMGLFLWTKMHTDEIVAEIRGEEITAEEHNLFKEKYESWSEFAEQEEFGEFATKNALDFLMLETALEDEAEKRNIEVTTEEIEERYQAVVSEYGGESEFERRVDEAYGWTPELTKRVYKVEIYKEKLAPYILDSRDLWGVYVRWDANWENIPESQWDSRAREKFNQEFTDLFENNASKEEIANKVAEVQQEEAWFDPQVGETNIRDINDSVSEEVLYDQNEWEKIKELEEVGEQTDLIRSEGGYYVIYRLMNINKGPHQDWNEYIDAVREEDTSNIYSLEYKEQVVHKAAKDFAASTYDSIEKTYQSLIAGIVNIFSAEPVYASHDPRCNNNHFSRFYGTITDSATGNPISGVTARADHNLLGPTDGNTICHPNSTYSDSSNGSGGYGIGQVLGDASTGLECWTKWNLRFTHTNYETRTLYNRSLENNGSAIKIDVTMDPKSMAGVVGLRLPGDGLTQSDVDGTPVRVRNPAECSSCDYNERDDAGSRFKFDDVVPGSISITTATGAAGGEPWQIRHRTRMCSGWDNEDCGSWSSWSSWSNPNGFKNVNRSVSNTQVLRIQFEYREPPPPDTSSDQPVSGCQETNGTVYLDYEGSVTVRFKAWISGNSEPGWQQSESYGSEFGGSRNYSFNIPNSAKDAFSNTRTKVGVFYTPRSENNYTRTDSVGPCGLKFDYEPKLDVTDPATGPKPGQSITISPRVSNCNEENCTTGPNYNYQLRITSGADKVGYLNDTKTLVNDTKEGIPRGATDHHGVWTLTADANATHGATVCIEMEINPTRGQMWPYYYTHPDNAPRSDGGCFDIYNEQFELSDISISGDDPYVVPDLGGTELEIEVRVVNNGDEETDPPPINNTGAKLGRSSGVTTTLEIYEDGTHVETETFSGSSYQIDPGSGGSTFTYKHNIANNTSEDTTYCFIAYANPTAGWSDGSSYQGAPFNDTPAPVRTADSIDSCPEDDTSKVATQSYFQVHRNDVASGMSVGRSDSPLSCDPMSTPERGLISGTMATRDGTREFGSFSEYAAYALGDIINFGTSVRGDGGGTSAADFYEAVPGQPGGAGTRLAFANTGPGVPQDGGRLGNDAYRCMPNLFEMLAKGSHSDVVDITGSDLNIPSNVSGNCGNFQFYSDNDITIVNGNIPSAQGCQNPPRVTLVVDGDITIVHDISMVNPKHYRGHGLALVASGDINIDDSVGKIDALLYAGGKLDSCVGENNLGTDVCDNQLTVTGTVIADSFDLKRTHGGVSGGRPKQPAEVFRFHPGIFTRPLYFVYADDQPRPDLPIQEMVDLPPLF